MPEKQPVVSHLAIQVGDKDLPPAILGQILEVTVDQHIHLPAMFSIRLFDPGMKLLDGDLFVPAQPVKIGAKSAAGKVVTLIEGEITALEPDFGEGMITELTVRGYDRSHRLYRERRSKTFLNSKDSDVAQQIASTGKLKTNIEQTPTVYEHIFQHNQSDLGFLQHRAWRIGFVCYVENGMLHFRQPKREKAQLTLAWGEDLIAFRPSLTVAEQAQETLVRGWDVQKKSSILGRGKSSAYYYEIDGGKTIAAWAKSFGNNRHVIVDQPVASQAEADILATARHNEASGAYLDAEGNVFRRPDVQAGRTVKIEGLGKRLSGDYLVTRATHVYTDEGLRTTFAVTGARNGLLGDLFAPEQTAPRWGGVVPAIVTNADDPNGWGRVKVKFPWLTDDEESAWARVPSVGGGPECGLAAIPAVDDEVMVAFAHNDFACPVVLGGLWNGADSPPGPVAAASSGEKALVRSWHSRTGHHVTIYDNADNKVEIVTSGGHCIVLNDAENKIEIFSKGDLEVAGSNIKIEASGNLDLQASGQVTVKGAMINLN